MKDKRIKVGDKITEDQLAILNALVEIISDKLFASVESSPEENPQQSIGKLDVASTKTKPIYRYERIPSYVTVNNTIKHGHSILTIAAIIDYTNNTLKFGWAVCSIFDNFEKKRGRDIATKRLNSTEAISIEYEDKWSIIQNIHRAYWDAKDDARKDGTRHPWPHPLKEHFNLY